MSAAPPLDRQAVIEALTRVVTPGIKLTALADDLGVTKRDYARLRDLLAELVADDTVHALPGGAFALVPAGRGGDRKAGGRRRARPASLSPRERAVVDAANDVGPVPEPAAPPARAAAPAAAKRPLPWRPPGAAPRTGAPSVGPVPLPGVLNPAVPTAASATASAAATAAATTAAAIKAHLASGEAVEGRITVHPAGYGFVATELGFDVFIPAKYRATSLDGDRVVVTTWAGVKGTEGKVESVVARGRARLTGILRRVGRAAHLEPDDPRIAADYGKVLIDGFAEDTASAPEGVAIVVEITRYPTGTSRELAGRVTKVLGAPDDPRTEIEKIIAVGGIPVEFPDERIAQGDRTSQELGPADFADRIDLRAKRFCTIDPETARDFDDALCIEDGPHGGPRVWIAVADVSHYVRWDDALDRECTLRGVSVYLPDRVISMLPLPLSAGICSLNPNVDRCAMVVRIDYTDAGEIVDTGYCAAVIRSHARLDYPGAAAALHGDFRGRREMYRPWLGEIERLDRLAQTIRAGRRARGALDLDLPEPKVILDADDPRLVRDVVKAKGDPQVARAYQLVEEFMIAANEAVGRFFRQRGAPTVWRVHAPPKRERLETLAELLGAYGIAVDVEEAATPIGMKRVIDELSKLPAARALNFLVLRSLTQAVWDTVGVGHFGLASADYLHFTSPIRRYPDLLAHRLLKHHLHREGQASGGGYASAPPTVERLTELARAASTQERRAMEAEREAVSMYRCYLVRDQVGDQFTGVVSAVTSFGVFIEIEDPYVEGLVKLDAFEEPMIFDEVHLTLTGRLTGRRLGLGDPVVVQIINVSVQRRRIELALVSGGTSRKGNLATLDPSKRPPRSSDRSARPDDRGGRPGGERGGRPGDRGGRPEERRGGRPDDRSGRPGDRSGRPGDRSGRPGDRSGRPGDRSGRPGDRSGRPGERSARPPERAPERVVPPAPAPRVGLAKARAAGRAVEKAQRTSSARPAGRPGKLSLKVSHRGRPAGKKR